MAAHLTNNDIYIGLFARRLPGDFHWLITIPTDVQAGVFTKFNATNTHGNNWAYQHAPHNILASSHLICLIRIGKCGGQSVDDIDAILKQLDMATPREFGGRKVPFDCRVWIWMAISALNASGIIHCDDYKALEKECQERGQETEAAGNGAMVYGSTHSQ